MKKIKKLIGLCFRCEERARVMEGEHGSRYECNNKNVNVCSCYMYKPVKPVVTKISKGYKKDLRFAPAIVSARETGCEILDGKLILEDFGYGKACLYWKPIKKYKK